jgi:alkylation response protein AidB-like acyl-CoA dehydrogenase
MSSSYKIKGGSFLLGSASPEEIFTPEDFTEEHRMIQDTVRKFMTNEVLPLEKEFEAKDNVLARSLLVKAGELGLLGIEISEDYGGLELDKISSTIVSEETSRFGSFAITMGAHMGIGTLPIVYYASPFLKEKYLPRLATAELVSAYALTEPGSGSDALSAKTKAVLSEDKTHYILNGNKMWITNGGFADIFVVFAKVDGDKFSAFVVERAFPGLTTGAEEHKLGIKGSSTTTVTLDNVKVPVENLLGEVGAGAKIALNILNIGRFKLGAGCTGSCKDVINNTLKYTSERQQFGKTINQFGLIQEKLGRMVIKTFLTESMSYRTIGHIQKLVDAIDKTSPEAKSQILKSIEEFSIECSIIKVFGSEALAYVSDEGVQCFGGYGYSQDYPAERPYRDARINRIFEGTNEINRLLITGMLVKKGVKGELDMLSAMAAVQAEITGLPTMTEESGELLAAEKAMIANAKKAVLLASGAGMKKFKLKLNDEQELLAVVADCVIEIYALESAYLRALKLASRLGEDKVGLILDIVRVAAVEAMLKIDARLREGAASIAAGDELRMLLMAFKRFMKFFPVDTKTLRRKIAAHVIEQGRYSI